MLRNEISIAKRMKFYIRDEELSGTRSVQRFYDKERRQKPGKERKNEKRNERVIQLEGKRIDWLGSVPPNQSDVDLNNFREQKEDTEMWKEKSEIGDKRGEEDGEKGRRKEDVRNKNHRV